MQTQHSSTCPAPAANQSLRLTGGFCSADTTLIYSAANGILRRRLQLPQSRHVRADSAGQAQAVVHICCATPRFK